MAIKVQHGMVKLQDNADIQLDKPPWLAALDGLCQPCADAEFYGLRRQHADCHHGDCQCAFVIPAEWPAGTWPAVRR